MTGGLVIAMCFQMVCYDSEQQEDYDTRYAIVEPQTTTWNGTVKKTSPALPTPSAVVSLYPAADEPHRRLPLYSDTPPSERIMECVLLLSRSFPFSPGRDLSAQRGSSYRDSHFYRGGGGQRGYTRASSRPTAAQSPSRPF